MLSHEQSFADQFNAYMRKEATTRGLRVHSFSLDGQDRDAGGDYVITDASRFALVEFKFKESQLISEAHKPRRLNLCQQLAHNNQMRDLHDQCHFIAWTQSPTMAVRLNVYRMEICTNRVFGQAIVQPATSGKSFLRRTAVTFAEDFLGQDGASHLSLEKFDAYVAWVLKQTSNASTSSLELITSNVELGELYLVSLSSLKDAQNWLRRHWPPAPTRRSPGYGP